jgi:trans-aconitate methyltransferase
MPSVDAYQKMLNDSPFQGAQVWSENADRYFPNVAAMQGWLDQPSIVPFKQHLQEPLATAFHEAAAIRMVELTKQPDGRCFETFRRINVSARK